jgi:hypothetical protein
VYRLIFIRSTCRNALSFGSKNIANLQLRVDGTVEIAWALGIDDENKDVV